MKIPILRKNFLASTLFNITLVILTITIIYFTLNKLKTMQTISPINISHNIQCDLTGDGVEDTLETLNSQNKIDFSINCSNNTYYLSNSVPDKILFTTNNTLEPKVFLNDISRDNVPEIILMGYKNNKYISYVFHWNKKNFDLVYSSENNILGILDCKNSRTPRCYSLSSSKGLSSLDSFMLINDSPLDSKETNTTLPSLDSVTSFINLIELPYVLDDLPDIFTTSIDKENLSLLWNLDKDNYYYTFQNAFFYDYRWNEFGDPSAIRWRLSFEKSNSKSTVNSKSELIFLVDLVKDGSSYKINAIQKTK
ncbi:hypothetical protein [Clostridium sp. BL-8]|uniref:hypothetical protein n=1 Tax=Clostridium sp. BL-8 TaxID=349938 RepID=UPI00098CDD96|nr:hypothetical protein [Clostridium sp. BL-8]OOM76752.1 hypothetical protein CLOBL_33460 [Clostridium sp. BL-8]